MAGGQAHGSKCIRSRPDSAEHRSQLVMRLLIHRLTCRRISFSASSLVKPLSIELSSEKDASSFITASFLPASSADDPFMVCPARMGQVAFVRKRSALHRNVGCLSYHQHERFARLAFVVVGILPPAKIRTRPVWSRYRCPPGRLHVALLYPVDIKSPRRSYSARGPVGMSITTPPHARQIFGLSPLR
jgi:hypothetical protein